MTPAQTAILLGSKYVIAVHVHKFGLINGLIRQAQQLIGIRLLGLRVEGPANTGRNLQRLFADMHG